MKDDRAGAVLVNVLLTLDLAVLVVDQVRLVGALIAYGQRLGVQLAGQEPPGQFRSAGAPFDGDPGLVVTHTLHLGMGSAALIVADEVHDRVLPVGILLKDRDQVHALVQQQGDLRLGGKVLAVLCPLDEHIARVWPGQEGMGSGFGQIDHSRLVGIFRIDLRRALALGIGDIAQSLRVDGDKDRGLGELHRREVIALAALNLKQQPVLALLGDRDDIGLCALIQSIHIAAEGHTLLDHGVAAPEVADHDAHVPAGHVNVVHPGDGEHIPVFIPEIALTGPLRRFRLRRLLPAGAQAQQQHAGHQQAHSFFHIMFSFHRVRLA